MTLVKAWTAMEWAEGMPQEPTDTYFGWNVAVVAGSTLLRTVASINLTMTINAPHFPPGPIIGLYAGLYQWFNVPGVQTGPRIVEIGRDWLWYQEVPFIPTFGVTSAVQSDLQYQGNLQIDSQAQRKVTVANPQLTLALGPATFWRIGVTPQDFTWTWQAVIRQLWEHEI